MCQRGKAHTSVTQRRRVACCQRTPSGRCKAMDRRRRCRVWWPGWDSACMQPRLRRRGEGCRSLGGSSVADQRSTSGQASNPSTLSSTRLLPQVETCRGDTLSTCARAHRHVHGMVWQCGLVKRSVQLTCQYRRFEDFWSHTDGHDRTLWAIVRARAREARRRIQLRLVGTRRAKTADSASQ